MSAIIRTSGLPADFKPKSQVQVFADAVQAKFGLDSFGTYAGHEPTADLALDTFVSKAQGDELAAWAVENIEYYGLDYVIWWQRIYNPEIATYWRDMADRGGITQNHKDHVHVSFEVAAPAWQQGEGELSMADIQAIYDALDNITQILTTAKSGDPGVKPITQATRKELADVSAKVDKLVNKAGA